MHALLWSDYVCPWAYLGRDRTAIMRGLGVEITQLPYELHPEIPPEGVAVRPGSRLDRVFAMIGAECEQDGIEFRAPTRSPNTRHVLEITEVVRLHAPDAFASLDTSIARARWVDGLDIGDRDLIADLVAASGAPVDQVTDLVADGAGTAALAASMHEARERGVTATPAWWLGDALLVPGAQPRETITRWVTRLIERQGANPSMTGDGPPMTPER